MCYKTSAVMKTRQKPPHRIACYQYDIRYPDQVVEYELTFPSFSESIVTSVPWFITSERSGKKAPKMCTHMRFSQMIDPYEGTHRHPPDYDNTTVRFRFAVGVQSPQIIVDAVMGEMGRYVSYPDVHKAYKDRLDLAANQFSAINFVVEMGEIPSLLRAASLWDGLGDIARKRVDPRRLKQASAVKRQVANAHLANSLAYTPFLGDVQSLGASLVRFHRTFEEVKARVKEPIQISLKRKGSFRLKKVWLNDFTTLEASVSWETCASASMHGSLDMSPEAFKVYNALDSAGIYFDAGVVWDALPFTFIFDYFVPLGDALETLRGPWVDIGATASNASKHIRLVIDYEVSISDERRKYSRPPVEATTSTGQIMFFQRTLGLPERSQTLKPLKLETPSLRQGSILAALAASRGR